MSYYVTDINIKRAFTRIFLFNFKQIIIFLTIFSFVTFSFNRNVFSQLLNIHWTQGGETLAVNIFGK